MGELYKIGEKLVTTELWKAALLDKIFGNGDMEYLYPFDGEWFSGFKSYTYCDAFYGGEWHTEIKPIEKHCITVTEENQKFLSPVPMVGDLVVHHGYKNVLTISGFCREVYTNDRIVVITKGEIHDFPSKDLQIEKRTYPCDIRAPLIEFEEVVEP